MSSELRVRVRVRCATENVNVVLTLISPDWLVATVSSSQPCIAIVLVGGAYERGVRLPSAAAPEFDWLLAPPHTAGWWRLAPRYPACC